MFIIPISAFIFWSAIISCAYAEYTQVSNFRGRNFTLVTNLDDNQVCYIHIYGIHINARRKNELYAYGFWPAVGGELLTLVMDANSNRTLATAEQFVKATKVSEHSPEYDSVTNYCQLADELLQEYKERNKSFRQTTPYVLRDAQLTSVSQNKQIT